jgi:O-succinylbenzoate synthase
VAFSTLSLTLLHAGRGVETKVGIENASRHGVAKNRHISQLPAIAIRLEVHHSFTPIILLTPRLARFHSNCHTLTEHSFLSVMPH